MEKIELIYRDECYRITGAVFGVYREIGCGFLEAVYHDCLAREFRRQNIPFETKKMFRLHYRGELIHPVYVADFVCYETIIVEIKAVSDVADVHKAQVLNYLKMSGLKLGLLANFGHYPNATVDRIPNLR